MSMKSASWLKRSVVRKNSFVRGSADTVGFLFVWLVCLRFVTFLPGDDYYCQPDQGWAFCLPMALRPATMGWRSGFYTRRWQAVDAALRTIGVIE